MCTVKIKVKGWRIEVNRQYKDYFLVRLSPISFWTGLCEYQIISNTDNVSKNMEVEDTNE